MTKDQEVSYVHTTCRNCVFAQYENKSQTGCSLNKLQDYREAGIEILEVYDDTDTEFCLINGRFCLFYRNQELMEKYPRDSWEEIAKLTTKCPYHVILFFEEDHSFKDLKRTLKNLKSQEVQPNLVTVLNKQYLAFSQEPEKYVRPSLLLDLLTDCKFHQFNLKNVYDKNLSDRGLIDLVFDSSGSLPYPIYTVFRSNFDIPSAFSKELNDSVLIKMMQIGFGTPVDDINGMIVNRTAHKKHGGNAFGIHLEDKIKKFEDNAENFIHEASSICPSLKTK